MPLCLQLSFCDVSIERRWIFPHRLPDQFNLFSRCLVKYQDVSSISYPVTQAVVLTIALAVSIVGLVLNISFICHSFHVRRMIYMSVNTTLLVGILWLFYIPPFINYNTLSSEDSSYCGFISGLYFIVANGSEAILFHSISLVHLSFLCRFVSGHNEIFSKGTLVTLEILFVMLAFVIPPIMWYIAREKDWLSIIFIELFYFAILVIIIWLFTLVVHLLSMILAYFARCLLTRRRRRKGFVEVILKENAVFLLLFIVTFIALLVSEEDEAALMPWATALSVVLSFFPLGMFVYLCIFFRSGSSSAAVSQDESQTSEIVLVRRDSKTQPKVQMKVDSLIETAPYLRKRLRELDPPPEPGH